MQYLCLLAFVLVGCGPSRVMSGINVDPDLQPYFERFTLTIGVPTDGISASFGNLTAPMVGECILGSDGSRAIEIDSAHWAQASDDDREQVLFHELGHCAMHLGHVTATSLDGCPVSIMYPYEFGNTPCYANNKAYYYQELESHK